MSENIYYYPQDYGLEQLTAIEFTDESYQFDTRVVWRRLTDHRLLTDRDSGCSCPSPFESTRLEDLKEIESTGWLKEEFKENFERRGYPSVQDFARFIEIVEKHLAIQPGGAS